jgi:hypothetical protein
MFDLVVVKNSFTEFFEIKNICKSTLEIPLFRNLLLDISKNKKREIEEIKNDFFKSRAIDLKTKNKTLINIFIFCDKIKDESGNNLIIYLVNNKDKERREIYSSWFLDLRC